MPVALPTTLSRAAPLPPRCKRWADSPQPPAPNPTPTPNPPPTPPSQISEGVKLLERELHAQVSDHHDDLLTQAMGIAKLEGECRDLSAADRIVSGHRPPTHTMRPPPLPTDVLKMVASRVESLQKSAERIRQTVDVPYQKIVTRTAQLARLQVLA